jgi:predicted amidohydrolase
LRASDRYAFAERIEYFVASAADYGADFIVLPELLTFALVGCADSRLDGPGAVEFLTERTDNLREALSDLAVRYRINIIGGSHLTRVDDGKVRNLCCIALRDGSVHVQHKIHATPDEAAFWGVEGGSAVEAIDTDCGKIGVLICYDAEFPELARGLADQGAQILFVPFCTDNRAGYLRVRHCAAARAIENQCFVVLAGNVGNLPNVANMDIQYAQSCILTPCDFPFARDGIAAEATENVETLTISDVNLADLSWARAEGTVRNLADRRFDLYRIEWEKGSSGGDLPDGPTPARKGGPGGG